MKWIAKQQHGQTWEIAKQFEMKWIYCVLKGWGGQTKN